MPNLIYLGRPFGDKIISLTPEKAPQSSPIRFLDVSNGQQIAEKQLKATFMSNGVKTKDPEIVFYQYSENRDNITGIYMPTGSILYSPPLRVFAGTTLYFNIRALRPAGAYLNSRIVAGLYEQKDAKKDVPYFQPPIPWTENHIEWPIEVGTGYVDDYAASASVTTDDDGDSSILRFYIQAVHQIYVSHFYAYAKTT